MWKGGSWIIVLGQLEYVGVFLGQPGGKVISTPVLLSLCLILSGLFPVNILPAWSLCVLLLSDKCLYVFLAYMQGNKVSHVIWEFWKLCPHFVFSPINGNIQTGRKKAYQPKRDILIQARSSGHFQISLSRQCQSNPFKIITDADTNNTNSRNLLCRFKLITV